MACCNCLCLRKCSTHKPTPTVPNSQSESNLPSPSKDHCNNCNTAAMVTKEEGQGVRCDAAAETEERSWCWSKFIGVIAYIFQRCFCRVKSTALVKPNGYCTNCKDSFEIYFPNDEVALETGSTQQPIDESVTLECSSAQKVQSHRPGTPRYIHFSGQGESPAPGIYFVKQQDEGIGDSAACHKIFSIEISSEPEIKPKSSGDDDVSPPTPISPKPISTEPISLVIGPEPVALKEVANFLSPGVVIDLLMIEFDIRQQFPRGFSRETVFQILQMAFLHPDMKELRIRVDNWRLYVYEKENILPCGPRTQIRKDYPMRLKSLIVYCPGITLQHLLIWQGFLISQSQLETLICNFDSVEWIFYLPVLQNIRHSIRSLELYSITNYNGDYGSQNRFDWLALGNAEKLENLKIWGDSRYYGLRHKNFENWNLQSLTEIELKYVDLAIKDFQHLLLDLTKLRNINLSYFTPIQIPVSPETSLPGDQFIKTLGQALSEQRIHFIRLTDYELPVAENRMRHLNENSAPKWGYLTDWSFGANADALGIQHIFFELKPFFRRSHYTK